MLASLPEQEREAAELFGRAERRLPVNHSVVRLPGSVFLARTHIHTYTYIPFRALTRVYSVCRENMP